MKFLLVTITILYKKTHTSFSDGNLAYKTVAVLNLRPDYTTLVDF